MTESESPSTDLISSETEITTLTTQQLLQVAVHDRNFPRAQRAADVFSSQFQPGDVLETGLCAALNHEDSSIRRRAADLTGRVPFGSIAVQQKLGELLTEDRSWPVREAAANALGAWLRRPDVTAEPELLTTLLQCVLREREVYVGETALRALSASWPVDNLRENLHAALQADSVSVRRRALKAWTMLEPTSESLPELIRALNESHHKVRKTAAALLSTLGTDAVSALPELCRRLADGERTVAKAASQTLAELVPGLPAEHQYWAKFLNHPELTSLQRLQSLLQQEKLPAQIADDFQSICEQRANWTRTQLGRPRAPLHLLRDPDSTVTGRESILQTKPIGNAKNDARLEQECTWLMARLVELLFASLSVSENATDE